MTAKPPRAKPRAQPAASLGPTPRADPRVRELTAQLAHDVGKYLARTARNLALAGPLDADLVDMLVADLYGDRGAARPAARFAELAGALGPLLSDERLPAVGGLLAELDGLEALVRAGQPAAVARAVELALKIEQLLRALALQCQSPAKPVTR